MHALALHAAPQVRQLPSTIFVHDLYVRSAGSYMQPSAGAHAGPKCTHPPTPLLRQVKYAFAPAWYAQLGAGHPMSFVAMSIVPAEGVGDGGVTRGPSTGDEGGVVRAAGGAPHAARASATHARIRTPRLYLVRVRRPLLGARYSSRPTIVRTQNLP